MLETERLQILIPYSFKFETPSVYNSLFDGLYLAFLRWWNNEHTINHIISSFVNEKVGWISCIESAYLQAYFVTILSVQEIICLRKHYILLMISCRDDRTCLTVVSSSVVNWRRVVAEKLRSIASIAFWTMPLSTMPHARLLFSIL